MDAMAMMRPNRVLRKPVLLVSIAVLVVMYLPSFKRKAKVITGWNQTSLRQWNQPWGDKARQNVGHFTFQAWSDSLIDWLSVHKPMSLKGENVKGKGSANSENFSQAVAFYSS